MPDLEVYPIDLPIFYDQLSNFIKQLKDDSSTNKYKLKNKISEEIYDIARDLKEIFDTLN